MKGQRSVLIVSSAQKAFDYLADILPSDEFMPVLHAESAGEAKRTFSQTPADLLIINTPLPDEFGIDLALEMAEGSTGILLLVKSDLYEQVAYKVEDNGILTLPKPNGRQVIYSTIKLLAAMNARLCRMERKNQTLQEKMADIRTVNRAKWLLIENLKMSEPDAHYFIEKQAMDTRMSRREVAEGIIRTYDC